MIGLTLNLFLKAAKDAEKARYMILQELQNIRKSFSKSRLYPHLGNLINLHSTLANIVNTAGGIRKGLPREVKNIDVVNREIVYEHNALDSSVLAQIEELILWTMPKIKATIEEGQTIYEFVDDNLAVEIVGILPAYLEEGYFFVPDNRAQSYHLVQYEVSIFSSANERFRRLKTRLVETVRQDGIVETDNSLKLRLIKRNPTMPNPATYRFDTELAFPFAETVYPIAKRKLLRQLFA